jgi:hypothetical protein
MKKTNFLLAAVLLMAACTESTTKNEAAPEVAVVEVPAKVDYGRPIKYTEWEIGKPENVKTVLNFYSFWDNKETEKLASLFADTLILRVPGETTEMSVPNNKINQSFTENRGEYKTTTNQVLSAISLHDRESNEDWVMITTYSKWEEVSGKRDSIMYSDSWRLKDGKISFLMSFDKKPTKNFLKSNLPVK